MANVTCVSSSKSAASELIQSSKCLGSGVQHNPFGLLFNKLYTTFQPKFSQGKVQVSRSRVWVLGSAAVISSRSSKLQSAGVSICSTTSASSSFWSLFFVSHPLFQNPPSSPNFNSSSVSLPNILPPLFTLCRWIDSSSSSH